MTPYHWVGMVLSVIGLVSYVTLTYANLRAHARRGTSDAKAAQTTALSAIRDAAVAHRDAVASHGRIDSLLKTLSDKWERESRELAMVAANLAAFDKQQGVALGLIYSRLERVDVKLDQIYKDGCARACGRSE